MTALWDVARALLGEGVARMETAGGRGEDLDLEVIMGDFNEEQRLR